MQAQYSLRSVKKIILKRVSIHIVFEKIQLENVFIPSRITSSSSNLSRTVRPTWLFLRKYFKMNFLFILLIFWSSTAAWYWIVSAKTERYRCEHFFFIYIKYTNFGEIARSGEIELHSISIKKICIHNNTYKI